MTKLGVVDVGGGLRGAYASAVLDFCQDEGIRFDCCVGVSAGSANLSSYLSGQRGRNIPFYLDYPQRKEYMSFGNFVRTGSYLDLEYLYGTLSNSDGENPLDYEALCANPAEFYVVAQRADTGEAVYFTKDDMAQDDYRILMASSCLPGVDKPYFIDGVPYFDGALADPVPVKKAFELGCDRVLLILTKPADVPREVGKDRYSAKMIRKKYPKSADNLMKRAERYNAGVDYAKSRVDDGSVLIVAPSDTGGVSTLSKDAELLKRFYDRGYEDAHAVTTWLERA